MKARNVLEVSGFVTLCILIMVCVTQYASNQYLVDQNNAFQLEIQIYRSKIKVFEANEIVMDKRINQLESTNIALERIARDKMDDLFKRPKPEKTYKPLRDYPINSFTTKTKDQEGVEQSLREINVGLAEEVDQLKYKLMIAESRSEELHQMLDTIFGDARPVHKHRSYGPEWGPWNSIDAKTFGLCARNGIVFDDTSASIGKHAFKYGELLSMASEDRYYKMRGAMREFAHFIRSRRTSTAAEDQQLKLELPPLPDV